MNAFGLHICHKKRAIEKRVCRCFACGEGGNLLTVSLTRKIATTRERRWRGGATLYENEKIENRKD